MKAEIVNNTVIKGLQYGYSYSNTDRSWRQKINKKTSDLTKTTDQMKHIHMEHSTHNSKIHILLSAHKPFFRAGHTLGHETSLNN